MHGCVQMNISVSAVARFYVHVCADVAGLCRHVCARMNKLGPAVNSLCVHVCVQI